MYNTGDKTLAWVLCIVSVEIEVLNVSMLQKKEKKKRAHFLWFFMWCNCNVLRVLSAARKNLDLFTKYKSSGISWHFNDIGTLDPLR